MGQWSGTYTVIPRRDRMNGFTRSVSLVGIYRQGGGTEPLATVEEHPAAPLAGALTQVGLGWILGLAAAGTRT